MPWASARLLRLVVLLACVGVPAFAQEPPGFTFVAPDDDAPFSSLDAAGRPRGFSVELVRAIAREAGFGVDVVLLSRGEMRTRENAHPEDVRVVSGSEAAQGLTLLAPLWQMRKVAIFRTPRASPPHALDDLAGETVAVVSPSSSHDELLTLPDGVRPRVIPTASHSESLRRLRAGEATVVIGNSLPIRTAPEFAQQPLFESEIDSVAYYLAAPDPRQDLQQAFIDAYVRLQQSGELAAIVERNLLVPGGGWWVGWEAYLIAIPAIAAIAFAGMAVWSRSLHTQVQSRTRDVQAALELHRATLESTADGILVTDIEGRVTSYNARLIDLWRFPAEVMARGRQQELLEWALSQVVDRSRASEEPAAPGLTAEATVALVPLKDGRVIERHIKPQVVDGHVVGRVWSFRDITARVREEHEVGIRAREQAALASLGQRALAGIEFQLLADQAMATIRETLGAHAAAIFELSDNGFTLRSGSGWVSGAIEHVQRRPSPSAVLRATLEHENVLLMRAGEGIAAGDPLFEAEHLDGAAGVLVPGRWQPFGVLFVAMRAPRAFSTDDRHFLHGVANVLGAAYQRAAVEEELRRTLGIHRATLESTAEGILAVDDLGNVTSYNQRLLDIFHYPADIVGRRRQEEWFAWGLGRVADRETAGLNLRRAMNSLEPVVAVVHLADGRVFERHMHPQLLDGRVVGRVWSFRDITERVRGEEERRRVDAHMQQVQKLESLGVLAGGIAHDFNNLLVGLLGHAGLALMDVPADSPIRARLTQIETAAMRAAELTNQMLAYSGRGHFIIQPMNLSSLVQEMATLLGTAVAKNAALDLRLAADLPSVRIDSAQLRQVVMNLIINASDAIGAAPGRIEISTSVVRMSRADLDEHGLAPELPAGDYVCLRVRDTGCGMDAATRQRIFEPFFTTKFTGRGLGLASVLGIVRGHRGAIRIDTAPGEGTTFRVLLPAESVVAEPAAVPAPRAASAVPHGVILVVDDEPPVRLVARESLQRAGFTVITAEDGDEAIQAIERGEPHIDAVLLDLTMRRMGGLEACRLMRAMRPELRIVLTSGYAETDDRCAVDGLAGFIQKPFVPSALVDVMSRALAGAGAESR